MFQIRRRLTKWYRFIAGSLFGPSVVRFNPVPYLCNHDCPMCWRLTLDQQERVALTKKAKTALQMHDYQQLLAELPSRVREIELVGGGEPLLFVKIVELIRLIKESGRSGSLITNGAKLSTQIINALVVTQWQKVRISVHASSASAYLKVNGRNDLETIKKVVSELIASRGDKLFPKVTLLFVIQRDNVDEIESFMDMAISLGVNRIEYDWLLGSTPKVLKLTPLQKSAVIKRLIKLSKVQKIEHNISHLLGLLATHPNWGARGTFKEYSKDKYCQIILDSLEFDGYGQVVPCCIAYGSTYVTHWQSGGFWKVWKSFMPLRYQLVKGKFANFCSGCTYSLDTR